MPSRSCFEAIQSLMDDALSHCRSKVSKSSSTHRKEGGYRALLKVCQSNLHLSDQAQPHSKKMTDGIAAFLKMNESGEYFNSMQRKVSVNVYLDQINRWYLHDMFNTDHVFEHLSSENAFTQKGACLVTLPFMAAICKDALSSKIDMVVVQNCYKIAKACHALHAMDSTKDIDPAKAEIHKLFDEFHKLTEGAPYKSFNEKNCITTLTKLMDRYFSSQVVSSQDKDDPGPSPSSPSPGS
jgi:hypothetical protein